MVSSEGYLKVGSMEKQDTDLDTDLNQTCMRMHQAAPRNGSVACGLARAMNNPQLGNLMFL